MAPRKKRKKALALQWIEYVIFRSLQGFLRLLPETVVSRFGALLGTIGFRLARSRTRLALSNISLAMPELSESERQDVIRNCWRQFGAEMLNYVRTIDSPASDVRRVAGVENIEHLESVLEQSAGVVLYTAHFGAWESAIGLIQKFNIPFAVVARPLDNELLEALLQKARKRFDVEMVPKRNAARVLMRRLAKKEGVLVLPDQAVHPREGVLVPFLGQPAWTTAAPARLALRYGTPILGAFCYRRDGRVVAELTEPIFTGGMEESAEKAEELTRQINDRISEKIRENPSLWLWMHDRWKNVE